MSTRNKVYKLNKIQQLVDLNGDATNFRVKFTAKTQNPTDEFEVLVLNQTQLDSDEVNSLEYKKVKGSISGNIVSDKSIYQNFFLALRGENDKEVMVDLDFEELPENKELSDQKNMVEQSSENTVNTVKSVGIVTLLLKYKFILLLLLLVGAGVVYYFFFYKKNNKKKFKRPVSAKDSYLNSSPSTPNTSPNRDVSRRSVVSQKSIDVNLDNRSDAGSINGSLTGTPNRKKNLFNRLKNFKV